MDRTIPILDLGGAGRDPDAFAGALGRALADLGFVAIAGHSLGDELVDGALRSAGRFFDLPLATKLRYEIAGGAGQRGYTRFGVEKAKDQQLPDLKEFFHVGREVERTHPLAHALLPNVWPREVPEFRATQLALFDALERVGARLLAAVARFLGLEPDWFAARTARANSILRAIRYPPVERGGLGLRAAAHEDINLITLLVGSGEPGLELRTREGAWIPVATRSGASETESGAASRLIVNVGDMLQRLTNGVLRSATHRVVVPAAPWDARPRDSIPFFLHFDPDVVIRTLPGCVTRERPDRHPAPITAHDYLQERLREIGLLEEPRRD